MNFSVIIPSKTASNLFECLAAVHANASGTHCIVVDDGVDWEGRAYFNLTMVPGVKPFIFARNVNIGINATREPLDVTQFQDAERRYVPGPPTDVILLNDDALLRTPGGFSLLAKFAEEHPEVGCVAPATNVTGQPLQWPRHRTPEGYRFVDTIPYVCVYIPQRTLCMVGLLDERYCLDYGCEDLDHTEAMKRAGLKIAVLYDVYVDHGSLRSSFRGDPRAPKSYQQNYGLFKQKWGIA